MTGKVIGRFHVQKLAFEADFPIPLTFVTDPRGGDLMKKALNSNELKAFNFVA